MNHNDLPREVRDEIGTSNPTGMLRLASLGRVICEKRDDAVTARKSSGIEDTWLECEESYLGIDDENRSEFMGARWIKPTNMSGPVTTSDGTRRNSSNVIRATAFVRMTSRFVDVGSAKIGEITLPIDDKAFTFTHSPVPSLVKAKDDKTQVVHPQYGALTREPKPGEPAGAEQPLTQGDLADEQLQIAEKSAKKAEKRIYDWMVESHYPAEMRKVQFDAARLGSGILKGPYPEIRIDRAVTKDDKTGKKVLKSVERIAPGYKWIDIWNFYPDPACGEDIHSGNYVFEKDYLSPRVVEDLKDNPAYIRACVEKVLEIGPSRNHKNDDDRPTLKSQVKDDGRYETWYFYGVLTRQDIDACAECGVKGLPKDQESIYAIVTLINDMPVRVTINPLESGEFCYHNMPWRRRAGHWAGVGVGEQIRTPQRMANAATRMLLVNGAKAAGSQIVMSNAITPMDGNWTIYPDKLWRMNPDATVNDVQKAFQTFEFPSAQEQMMGIIEYAFKLAEETSNIPLISQGQSGKTTPETLGGQQLQDNNANQLLRSVGYMQDDTITEPVVLQSYEWLLLDPDVPDDEKGDFDINAHGSAAMVERYIQNLAMPMILQISANPVYGLDPKKAAVQSIKSQRLDPRDFKYTEDEQKQIDAQPAQPAPAVAAAQIRAASSEKIAATREQGEVQRSKVDTDRDTAYNQSLTERDRVQGELAREKLQLEREKLDAQIQLAMLEYANREKVTLTQVKSDLAKTAMVENTKRELAAAEIALAQSEGRNDRTHSLIRDEISTSVTP